MPRIIAVMLITVIITLSSPNIALSPELPSPSESEELKNIFTNIIADYEVYTSLLSHTYYYEPYQVLTCVDNPESAVSYLTAGFSHSLSQSIADYYLHWVPQLGKMAVIPTDSIPVITAADLPYINVHRKSPDEVVLERIYTDCYELGDRYLYRITAHKEESRWIIVDLSLEPLPEGK